MDFWVELTGIITVAQDFCRDTNVIFGHLAIYFFTRRGYFCHSYCHAVGLSGYRQQKHRGQLISLLIASLLNNLLIQKNYSS